WTDELSPWLSGSIQCTAGRVVPASQHNTRHQSGSSWPPQQYTSAPPAMRLAVLVLAAAAAATSVEAEEHRSIRLRRSIGSWFSDFFKKWKESDDDYDEEEVITVPVIRPIYQPPVKSYYPPPAPPIKPSYGPPLLPPSSYGRGHVNGGFGGGGSFNGGFGGGGPFKGGFGGGGVGIPIQGGYGGGGGQFKGGIGGGGGGFGGPIKGGIGGGGGGFGGPINGGFGGGGGHFKGGIGGGDPIKGGFGGGGVGGGFKGGVGGGGPIKGGYGGGIGGGGHFKGGHGGGGHIKGGHSKGLPHDFGPVKDSDVVHIGGGSFLPPALPAGGYSSPADSYAAPPAPVNSYVPPVIDIYGPPKPIDSYAALPTVSTSYSSVGVPVAPLGPGKDLISEFRSLPSFPLPMAEHGSSSSSYLEGFHPSQPLAAEHVGATGALIGKEVRAPLRPLYDLPSDSKLNLGGSALPLAGGFDALGSGKGSIGEGFGASVGLKDQHSSSTASLTYGAELGYDDPIIEIIFQDGEPAPPPPPPVIDPEVFALPEEPVEVYFIEYSPGDNIDDLGALNLEGAKPGILHDLPEELPIDVRSHLLDSGVLDNAEIQVINLDDALTKGFLDQNTRQALEAVYASESRIDETKVDAPSKEGVNIRVHRLMNEDGTPKGVAELLSGLGKYREGRFAGLVEANDEGSKKFIPVIVDGDKLPLPNHPGLEGREVAGVLVLAPTDKKNQTSAPPANTSSPEHNLVESASNPQPVVAAAGAIEERADREWNGDPNGWRPVWD
ncbi:hypothetical protein OTU49_015637, partial [Cherax quadricarinatus]